MENKLPIDILSQLSQFETTLINLAPLVASYYEALIDAKVPTKLATQLTLDWHNAFWNKAYK